MADDIVKQTYDQFSTKINLGDEKAFRNALKKKETARQIYDQATNAGFNTGDYETFERAMGVAQGSGTEKVQQPKAPQTAPMEKTQAPKSTTPAPPQNLGYDEDYVGPIGVEYNGKVVTPQSFLEHEGVTTAAPQQQQAQPAAPRRNYSAAPRFAPIVTWGYTKTAKAIDYDSPINKAAMHASDYLNSLSSSEVSSILSNKNWNDLAAQAKALEAKYRGGMPKGGSPASEHDIQLYAAITNQMVALENNFSDANEMARNPGKAAASMYKPQMRKTNHYLSYYERLAKGGANMDTWNPFASESDWPESVRAMKEKDRKAGNHYPDNFYYWMCLKDKDFNSKFQAWSLICAEQKNKDWTEVRNNAAAHADRRAEQYKEEEAKKFGESSWFAPVSGLFNSGIGELVATGYRFIDQGAVDDLYDLLDRSTKYASEGQQLASGIFGLGVEAVTAMPVYGGAAVRATSALSKVFTITPKAARIMQGGLSFMFFEGANSILSATSRGNDVNWAEVAGNSAKGFLLGGGGAMIGGGIKGMAPNVTGRAANYGIRALGDIAEVGLFAGTEMAMEYLKDGKVSVGGSLLSNGAIIFSMKIGHGIAGGKGFGIKRDVSTNTIGKVKAKGYDALAKDLERYNASRFREGEFQLSDEGMRQLEELQGNMSAGGGLSWANYAEIIKPTGVSMTKPGVNSVDVVKEGDNYYVATYDINGVEIERSKSMPQGKAQGKVAKMQKTVERNKEIANEQVYASQRDAAIQSRAARIVADELNQNSGVSPYLEDGVTPNPDYQGLTADEVLRDYQSISETPVEQRTKEQNDLVSRFEQSVGEISASVPQVDAVKAAICEQYGITEDSFDNAWNDPKKRKGKEAEACAVYNTVLARGYNISAGEAVGSGFIDGAEVKVLNRVEMGEDMKPKNPNAEVYYTDESGKVQKTTAANVADLTLTPDVGAEADRLSNENRARKYNEASEQFKNQASAYSTEELERTLVSLSHAAESGADSTGEMAVLAEFVADELGRRYQQEWNGLTHQQKVEKFVSERFKNLSDQQRGMLEMHYTEKPLEFEEAMNYDSTHRAEVKAVVDAMELRDTDEWNRKFDELSADDATFEKEYKERFKKDPTKKPRGFDMESPVEERADVVEETEVEETAPEADVVAQETQTEEPVETEVEEVETPEAVQPVETDPVQRQKAEAFVSAYFPTLKGDAREARIQEVMGSDFESTVRFDKEDGVNKDRTDAYDKAVAELEKPKTEPVEKMEETPAEDVAKPSQPTEQAPQPENEMKPAEVPEAKADAPKVEETETPEAARDRKINELLDFMGLEGKDREYVRDAYLAEPERLEEEYSELQSELQKADETPKEETEKEPEKKKDEEPVAEEEEKEDDNVIVDDPDTPMPTKEVKGRKVPDYSKSTPARTRKFIYEDLGYDKETADGVVNDAISAAKDALKKHKKTEPKRPKPDEVFEYAEKKAAWDAKKSELEGEQAYWEEVAKQQKTYDVLNDIREAKTPQSMSDLVNKLRQRYGGSERDGELYDAVTNYEPKNLYEACMQFLTSGARFVWDAEGSKKGLKQQTGWGDGERRKMIGMIAKEENGGITPEAAVHKIVDLYGEDLGIGLDQSDVVLNTLLEALQSVKTKGDASAFVNARKLANVEDILLKRINGEGREDLEADRRANEEFEALKEQYKDELPENPTVDDVANLMERKRQESEEVDVEGEQQGEETLSNETSGEFEAPSDEVPFSLKQEQTDTNETVAKDVRERLEEKVGKDLADRIENIANSLGVKVRFTDEDVNGFMDYDEGVLYIGKNLDSDKTEAFVAGHEFTHEMQTLSEGKGSDVYDTFKQAALEWAKEHMEEGGKGYDFDWLKKRYENHYVGKYLREAMDRGMGFNEAMKYAERKAKELVTDDYVNDEIAANVAGLMLENPAIAEDMFKLKESEVPQERRNRLRRLLDWIKEYVAKRIGNKKPEELTPEDQQLLELRDKFNDMYNEVVREDLDNEGIETSENGDARDYSVRTLTKEEQREDIIKGLEEHTGRSREDVEKWLESESSLASMILGNPETLDYTPDPRDPAIKKNSDYPQGTVDFSNICRKRKDFTNIYTILQKENPNRVFTALDLEEIRQSMIEDGYTVACGLCFVEDRRQLLGEIAEDFINRLENGSLKPASQKKIGDDKYIPTIAELITPEGSKALADEHPAVWEAFRAHNNARGQQAGRLYEGYNEYKREILNWNDDKVKKVNDVGGLRIFSFSDFEAPQLLDIIQIIEDCGAKGVKIQGYTKVPEFAKAIKDTGVKLNQSLIPKGDGVKVVDGKEVLDYDTVEGIDVNDKNFVSDPDNPNVGTILVGINDRQIRLAMQDPFVDYIIPFHTKIAKEVLNKKGIGSWTNYKNFQRDHDISTGRAAEKEINIYTDVLQAAEAEGNPITNKVEFVNKFLEVAKERGLEPRFSQFLDKDADGNYIYTEGYHKFLVDFKLFDKEGNIIPQEVVKPEFDDAFNKEILDNYAKDAKVEKDYGATLDKLRGRLGLEAPKRTHYEDMAEKYSSKEGGANGNVTPADVKGNNPGIEDNVQYSLREEDPPKKTILVYKLVRLGEDGKPYPLYIDNSSPMELGVWLNADSPNLDMLKDLPSDTYTHYKTVKRKGGKEKVPYTYGVYMLDNTTGETISLDEFNAAHPEMAEQKKKGSKVMPSTDAINWATGNGKRWVYIEQKETGQRRYGGEARSYYNIGINGTGSVETYAMRPGWHAGSLPTMRQIGKGANRDLRDDRFVWVEGEVSADIDYNEEAQGNPDKDIPTHIPTDGYYMKATNANAKASQADRVGWYIAGAFKPNRFLSDSEARKIIDDWNAQHPNAQVEYDFPRESGKEFNAETMQLEDVGDANKKTTPSERSGAVSGNSSAEGLPQGGSAHLSHGPLTTQAPLDAAKIQKNTETTLRAVKKIQNEGGLKGDLDTEAQAVSVLGKRLHLDKSSSSQSNYGDFYEEYYEGAFDVDGRTVRVRISTHPANGTRIGNAPTDDKISIVIHKDGEHKDKGPHNGFTEFLYEPNEISPADAANAIVKGVENLIVNGEYVDVTGKAHSQEYPYIKDGKKIYSLKEEPSFNLREEENAPSNDLAARMRERWRERMARAREAEAQPATEVRQENAEPQTETRTENGGGGENIPPTEPPTPPTEPPTPRPEPLPPTEFDRPATPIEQALGSAMKVITDTSASYEDKNRARKEVGRSVRDITKQVADLGSYGEKIDALRMELQDLKSNYKTVPREEYRQKKAEIEKKLNRLFKGKRFWKGLEEVSTEIENNGDLWVSNVLRQAEAAQRAYDKATVENVVAFAREMVNSGLIDHEELSRMNELFTAIKRGTGKTPKGLETVVNRMVDIMLKSQERQAQNEISQLLNTKAVKTENGIQKQGAVDLRGQHMLEEMNDWMGRSSTDIGARLADIRDKKNEIGGRLTDEEKLNNADYRDWDDKETGAMLAQRYQDNVESHAENIRQINEDLKVLKARHKNGEISGKAYTEAKRDLENDLREERIKLIESKWDAAADMNTMITEGRSRAKDFIEVQKAHKDEVLHNGFSDMQRYNKETGEWEATSAASQREKSFKDKLSNISGSTLGQSLSTLNSLLKQLGKNAANGMGYLYKRFAYGWVDCAEKEWNEWTDDCAKLDAKAVELFGENGIKRFTDIHELVSLLPKMEVSFRDGDEVFPHTLDQGQLLYIYCVDKMADGRRNLRFMGIDSDKVNEITEFLDPRLKEMADWLQSDFLVEKRKQYNETYRRMYGADMEAIENYFPLMPDKNQVPRETDIGSPDAIALPSSTTGSMMKRNHKAYTLDLMGSNAIDIVIKHLQDTGRWNNFGEWIRDANTLMSSKRFRNQVRNQHTIYGTGDKLLGTLENTFAIAAGAYKPKATEIDKFAVNVGKGVSASKVTFRAFTAMKQLLSLPAFSAQADPSVIMRNMARPKGSWDWCMKNLPLFDKRWQSRKAGDTRLESTELDWNWTRKEWIKEAARYGLKPNAFIDAVTIAIGARSVYDTRYSQYKKLGYKEADAVEKAMKDATIAFNETQQSSEGLFVAPMQVDRSWLAVGLSVFRNASMGYERLAVDGARDFKRSITNGKAMREYMKKMYMRDGMTENMAERAAKLSVQHSQMAGLCKIVTGAFLAPFAWNIGGQLPYLIFGDNGDEKKKRAKDAIWGAAAAGWLEGVAGGNVMSDVIQSIHQGQFRFDDDLMPISSDISRMMDDFFKTDKSGEAHTMRGWVSLANIIFSSAIGVNPQTATDIMVDIFDGINSVTPDKKTGVAPNLGLAKEIALHMMRIMQVPQSQLDQIFIDEINMTAAEAQKLTPKQLASRIAYYKLHKETPMPLAYAYSNDKLLQQVKNKEQQFFTKINEGAEDAASLRVLLDKNKDTDKGKTYLDNWIDALEKEGPTAMLNAREEESAKGNWYLVQRIDKRLNKAEKSAQDEAIDLTSYESKRPGYVARYLDGDQSVLYYDWAKTYEPYSDKKNEVCKKLMALGGERNGKAGHWKYKKNKDKVARGASPKAFNDYYKEHKAEADMCYKLYRIDKEIGDMLSSIDAEKDPQKRDQLISKLMQKILEGRNAGGDKK